MIRNALIKLAAGEVDQCDYNMILDVDAFRAKIEEEAQELGLEIIIRDHNDAWLPIAYGHLVVMRWRDYVDAYGVPR